MRNNIEHGWVVADRNERRPKVVFDCDWCGKGIEDGEDYFYINGERVCEDCVNDCKKEAYFEEED